jgi:cell division protein ZapE
VSVRERHEKNLTACGFERDPAQDVAIDALDDLLARLEKPRRYTWYRRVGRRGRRKMEPETGLYMWGGVGRGKTYLMDLFFECVRTRPKRRQHFHRFMYDLHARLRTLEDVRNPLDRAADDISMDIDLLCFDEFFVSDIADAMILAGLFTALFERGVTLVTTSNVPPDELYRDGLQRARFLPAIELIKTHTRVVHVAGDTDYRYKILRRAEIYHSPLDAEADENLARYFEEIAPDEGSEGGELVVEGRPIGTRRRADGVVWFDFANICDGPRGTSDYIEIARCFHTVIVSGVPQLDATKEDQARRFISLVDEFYDRKVKLILSAEVPLSQLYAGKRLSFEFTRTMSRLQEMRTDEYLALAHLP